MDELASFYSSFYFQKGKNLLGYSDYRACGEHNARRMWHEITRVVDFSSIAPKLLLDVGCATGGFLHEAALNAPEWELRGVELSPDAANTARTEFGLDVVQGDVFSTSLCGGEYGMVTMWHILEHTNSPLETLERISTLLAPNGWLFIELPNWNSLGRLVRGSRWSQLKPPEHINFFTPASLRRAVEQAGLFVLRSNSHYETRAHLCSPRLLGYVKDGMKIVASHFGVGGYVRLLAQKR
jgi:2-polyprenyl-3-methyl-5-hydroxy-6-metoxy-1,4-benzoquinol methylase